MNATPETIHVLHTADPAVADRVASGLERADDRFTVEVATGVDDAVASLHTDDPDCVVSMYALPDRTGIELLESVRESRPHLPVVLLAADGSEAVASNAIAAGVTDYLPWKDGAEAYATLADRIATAVETHRSRIELEAYRERLSTFVEQSPLCVIEYDNDLRIVRVNDAAEEILGYPESELRGETWERIVSDASYEGVEAVASAPQEAEGGYHSIDENVRKNGERLVCEWYTTVITDDDGGVRAVFSQFQDITDRSERERRIEALHEATRKLMSAATQEAVAEHAVETARDVLGLPINSVYLYDAERDALVPAAVTEEALDVVGEPPVYEPGESLSWEAFRAGEVRVFEDVSTEPGRYNDDTSFGSEIILPLGDHGVMYVAATEPAAFDEADVTLARTLAANTEEALSRIDRERALRESRRRYRTFVDNFPDGAVFLFDDDLRYILAGGAELSDVGLSPDEIEGATVDDLFPAALADELAEYYREALSGRTHTVEQEFRGEHYRIQTLPVHGDDGEITAGMAVSQNVTEQKRREQELAAQNERLEEFASVVSHDFRNPLNVADGRLDLARTECDSAHLDEVARAHERMSVLIDDLLTLAREGEEATELEPVALDDLGRNCWRNVETGTATLDIRVDRTIRADRGRLQQLLENLMRNSVEHGATSGRPEADDGAGPGPSRADGAAVAVTVGPLPDGFYVADDGPGIPPDRRDDVFDTGYSTDADGNGFGLSIVAQVADAHGWTVDLTESDAGGACIEVTGVEFVEG
ncbi:PAS domain S-box protein [Haloplanus sp.]|uniref:PAS domain S-box protein n=1 Tax=Haloplanus sp. TaxID=1961696 RepID=UPI0026158F3E|nr:PAS domain S-box protein [Haloplanus sp.]